MTERWGLCPQRPKGGGVVLTPTRLTAWVTLRVNRAGHGDSEDSVDGNEVLTIESMVKENEGRRDVT